MLFDVRLTVVIVARVERDRVSLVLRVLEISCDDIFSFLCIIFSALHNFFFVFTFRTQPDHRSFANRYTARSKEDLAIGKHQLQDQTGL